jgi:hypothetical protein
MCSKQEYPWIIYLKSNKNVYTINDNNDENDILHFSLNGYIPRFISLSVEHIRLYSTLFELL